MCAIGGIYLKANCSLPIIQYLESMLNIQRHRGPDAEGDWVSEENAVGLCHNRLSILDLSENGNQPMISADGRFVLVFNGEIYNYRQLQQELTSKGAVFRTGTDTEVLIEAYRNWGEETLPRLRGMFAFALYDLHSRVLFCARDRVGKKPFVYSETPDAFVFASEIPAVQTVPSVNTHYDHDAISSMLLHNLRHVPDPYTAYEGIKRLRPGHAMIVKDGRVQRTWRYWSPTPYSGPVTANKLRELLEESVALRMHADVPVGALLSGGVDSSAIVALMQQHSSEPIHTYALGFDKDDEDLRRARIMAEALGTRHREFYFNADDQWEIFNNLIRLYGDPIMLLPLVHTYALCRAIREDGIKVVLTGNGADELFYGYTGHVRTLKVSRWLDQLASVRSLFRPLKNTRLGWLAAKPGHRKAAFYRGVSKSTWSNCISNSVQDSLRNRVAEEMSYWGGLCPSGHYIDESNFIGLMIENSHSVTIAGDLPAMAASVEIRAPFLDQEIVNFALATPVEMKIPDVNNPNWLKAILREAVQDLVPDSLLKADKRGFGSGIQESNILRGPWSSKAEDLFKHPHDANGLFDPNKLLVSWRNYNDGHTTTAVNMAKLFGVQLWLRQITH